MDDWASATAPDRVRARFEGGTLLVASMDEALFLCLVDGPASAAESSPSSADASRDDGCSRSVVDDFGMFSGRMCEELRLRFPALEGDDEDMLGFLGIQNTVWQLNLR